MNEIKIIRLYENDKLMSIFFEIDKTGTPHIKSIFKNGKHYTHCRFLKKYTENETIKKAMYLH